MVRQTNDEWLTALQGGSGKRQRALSDLREYLRKAVFVYLRDRRSDLADASLDMLFSMADDFAQEALVAIQENLDTFRGDARFTTWAYRFVINAAAAELRRRQYRDVSLDQLVESGTAVLSDAFLDPQLDPAMAAERADMLQFLLTLMQTELNEKQRVALLGVYLQGYSIQEIADLLDTSPNTLYKILHDARKKMKAALNARHLSAGDILALFDRSE